MAALGAAKALYGGPPPFKLTIKLLGASVPGLPAPGPLSQQRPFLLLALGKAMKETEFADWQAGEQDCPWRFGESLTFRASLREVLGAGLRLRMRARKDVGLGPLQLEMRAGEVGAAALDLRRRVLPACVETPSPGRWASPVLLVPISHVAHGQCGGAVDLGGPVGHVALSFSLDVDPEPLLAAAEGRALPLQAAARHMGQQLNGAARWLGAECTRAGGEEEPRQEGGRPVFAPLEVAALGMNQLGAAARKVGKRLDGGLRWLGADCHGEEELSCRAAAGLRQGFQDENEEEVAFPELAAPGFSLRTPWPA